MKGKTSPRAAALAIACPVCGAAQGVLCAIGEGSQFEPHVGRYRAAGVEPTPPKKDTPR